MGTAGAAIPEECRWDVDGLRLAGLRWRPGGAPRVLALHGWMDHAASFRELAPRLGGCDVVALDLSGHGLSAHRAAHATYNIWDDLPQIARLLDLLGWSDCVLVGHSRGANIAGLFAAAQPERVRALVAIDSLAPQQAGDDFVATLRAFIGQTRKQTARPTRRFGTREDYVRRRAEQRNSRATSEALSERALRETADGFHMRGDPRLFASSAVKLTRADVEAVLRAIECPVLNIWATQGIRSYRPEAADLARLGGALIRRYEAIELDGDHHLHLDPAVAARMATVILDFLTRHLGD